MSARMASSWAGGMAQLSRFGRRAGGRLVEGGIDVVGAGLGAADGEAAAAQSTAIAGSSWSCRSRSGGRRDQSAGALTARLAHGVVERARQRRARRDDRRRSRRSRGWGGRRARRRRRCGSSVQTRTRSLRGGGGSTGGGGGRPFGSCRLIESGGDSRASGPPPYRGRSADRSSRAPPVELRPGSPRRDRSRGSTAWFAPRSVVGISGGDEAGQPRGDAGDDAKRDPGFGEREASSPPRPKMNV